MPPGHGGSLRGGRPPPEAPKETDAITVSIILPNLDCPWVGRALEALAAQGAPGPGVEVWVVGQDRHRQVRAFSEVRFLETAERLNPAQARNRGVEAASGDKLLFLDADCRPAPGWWRALAERLETSPVAGGAVTFPRRGNAWALADNIASFHELLPDRPAEEATEAPLGSLNLAATRRAWEAVGPFDEALTTSEDFDWVLRCRGRGLATAFVPQALVEHAAVRSGPAEVVGHATWYGNHFHAFRRRHPGVFDRGPTWKSRLLFLLAAPLKAALGTVKIFAAHRTLLGSLRALPGVLLFKLAWYRAVARTWPEDGA